MIKSNCPRSFVKVSGFEVDKNCITGTYGDLKGKDQDDDEWNICVGDYCF